MQCGNMKSFENFYENYTNESEVNEGTIFYFTINK
jgi:hypothetical protein